MSINNSNNFSRDFLKEGIESWYDRKLIQVSFLISDGLKLKLWRELELKPPQRFKSEEHMLLASRQRQVERRRKCAKSWYRYKIVLKKESFETDRISICYLGLVKREAIYMLLYFSSMCWWWQRRTNFSVLSKLKLLSHLPKSIIINQSLPRVDWHSLV